jgi:hypothetical protein
MTQSGAASSAAVGTFFQFVRMASTPAARAVSSSSDPVSATTSSASTASRMPRSMSSVGHM